MYRKESHRSIILNGVGPVVLLSSYLGDLVLLHQVPKAGHRWGAKNAALDLKHRLKIYPRLLQTSVVLHAVCELVTL